MCYISDWPKRFLKTILLQLSRHQVCMTHTAGLGGLMFPLVQQ